MLVQMEEDQASGQGEMNTPSSGVAGWLEEGLLTASAKFILKGCAVREGEGPTCSRACLEVGHGHKVRACA